MLLDPSAGGTAAALAAPTIVGLAQSGRFADAAHLSARAAQLAAAHHDQYRWGRGEVAVAVVPLAPSGPATSPPPSASSTPWTTRRATAPSTGSPST